MNVTYWSGLLIVLLVQLAVGIAAWWQLARRLRTLAGPGRDATGGNVPVSTLLVAIQRIEARLKQLESTREPVPSAPPESGDRAYQLAQRMARNGASAQQIADACGIAPREAELLRRVHAPTP